MGSLLIKIRSKVSIVTQRKVESIFEGEYSSVFKGRSMDFEDLREYIVGDDVKDIEWRSSARDGKIRIKRYIAIRKHNIMLVVDTSRSMAATAQSGDSKRDISVMVAGVIAAVAQKHGDLVALTAGTNSEIYHLPFKGSRAHVERILQYIHTRTTVDAPASNLTSLLDYVRRTVRRRALVVVISDNLRFAADQEQLLRRLAAQHELLFVAVEDLDPSHDKWENSNLYDVNSPLKVPSYIRRQDKINVAYQKLLHDEWAKANYVLNHLRISSVRIDSEDAVIKQVIRLLEKHKHVIRH